MTKIQFLPIADIKIPSDRFRQQFAEKNLTDLQDSISSGPGLINAITIKPNLELNTGESRYKAIKNLSMLNLPVKYQGSIIPEGTIPVIIVEAESMEELDFLEAELHENTHREGFTFIEEAQAIARIAKIRQAILNKNKKPLAERKVDIQKNFAPLGIPLNKISPEAIQETALQLNKGENVDYYTRQVKTNLQVANALEEDGELAKKLHKAKNLTDASKVLRKHAQEEQRANLAIKQGKSFTGTMHTVTQGDCIEVLATLPKASFDVCLTDPIYGIDAGNFADSSGRYNNFDHGYDDSLETFQKIMPEALQLVSKLLKAEAHLYLACDIRNYYALKEMVEQSSTPNNPWKVINAPFIQYKTAGGRVPHPGFTPRRSYELWLYAHRGGKQELKLINDVIPCEADKDETHGAKKPKELLKTFLNRSCMPGDTVLDFMAGSGSIIPACHELKLKCTAIELGQVYYGECLERLKELR